jgi:hypothetical protein
MLNGRPIERVTEASQRENIVRADLKDSEVNVKKGDMIGRTNLVCATFAHQGSEVRNRLFQSKCCHLYGCQAWQLSDPAISRFVTAQNRCTRRVLHLPYKTHRSLLPGLTGKKPCLDRIVTLSLKNVQCMQSSSNSHVSFVANSFVNNLETIIGANSHYCNSHSFFSQSDEDAAICLAISELLHCPPDGFSAEEATLLAHWLCEC